MTKEICEAIDIVAIAELAIPALLAVSGWFVASWLAANRERKKEKDSKRFQYLECAYNDITELRALDNLEMHELTELWTRISSAIELHGTKKQIETFRKVADEISENKEPIVVNPQTEIIKSKALAKVIEDLRNEIREYLEYEKVEGGISFLSHFRES